MVLSWGGRQSDPTLEEVTLTGWGRSQRPRCATTGKTFGETVTATPLGNIQQLHHWGGQHSDLTGKDIMVTPLERTYSDPTEDSSSYLT